MSSTDIEDVLSSIRRLVSEEMRPPIRTQKPVAANVDAGRLILTPALRVVQDNAPAMRQEFSSTRKPAEAAEPLPVFIATKRIHIVEATEAPFVEAEPAPLERVVASLGAAVTAQPEEWEPEHGDAPIVPGLAAEPWSIPEQAFALEPEDDLGSQEAAAIAVEPQQTVEVVSDEATLGDDAIPAWAQVDDFELSRRDDDVEVGAGFEEPVFMAAEPDPDWADAAEASVIAALQAETDEDGPRPFEAAGVRTEAEGEARFNEAVLRELVRDILREELAGPMGERITRNIRKLVRAEIAMILATKDLD